MQPNWFGWIMIAVVLAALLAGIVLWAVQIVLTVRHFIFLRRASGDWQRFFQLFRVGNAAKVRSMLPPQGITNLELALRLQKASLPLVIVGEAAVALAIFLGGLGGGR